MTQPVIPPDAKIVRLRPHRRQRELLAILGNPNVREAWIVAGRRFGKSWSIAVAATKFGLENPFSPAPCWNDVKRPVTRICVVAPDYERAMRIWDEVLFTFPETIKHKDKNTLEILLHGGAILKLYSGENIESMRGEGFDVVILDEAAFLNESQVDQVVMPTMLDRHGRLWCASTPKFGRKNWFARRFLEVRESHEKGSPISGTAFFHATSFDNPRIDPKDLEREIARRDPLTVREEYYGEILDSAANWLDHTKLIPIDRKLIPPNAFRVMLIDSAWGKPNIGLIDKSTRRRKDATVIAVVAQDTEGNCYIEDGTWAKDMQPAQAHAVMEGFLKKYNIQRIGKEVVADDPFFTNWFAYCKEHIGIPHATHVPFNRTRNWKIDGIRYFAGELLYKGKMFISKDCAIWPHLIDEIDNFSEADSVNDRCKDDCLTICADILQPGIYQGHRTASIREVHSFDPFFIKDQWDMWDHKRSPRKPLRSKYSIV